MGEPYYSDELVALFHGDCREITAWLDADVLVTDPPYGRNWRQGDLHGDKRDGIAGDRNTAVRDHALAAWNGPPAVVFGDLMLPAPAGTKQVLIYRKPVDAGVRGAMGGWRRDAEAYLVGPWSTGIGGRSSVMTTATRMIGTANGPAARYRHPHAKPLDVMEQLVDACPPGVIADPFAGSGSTLVAARNLGRRAVGVEIEERYCEIAARRLAQQTLPLEVAGDG